MLFVIIETISHEHQRYPTVGDWQFTIDPRGQRYLNITVSELNNPDMEFLVALHEMVEAWLCRHNSISQDMVDDFDKNWNNEDIYDEPGDEPGAPYHKEHVIAGIVERVIARELGINWDLYGKVLDTLSGFSKQPKV